MIDGYGERGKLVQIYEKVRAEDEVGFCDCLAMIKSDLKFCIFFIHNMS